MNLSIHYGMQRRYPVLNCSICPLRAHIVGILNVAAWRLYLTIACPKLHATLAYVGQPWCNCLFTVHYMHRYGVCRDILPRG